MSSVVVGAGCTVAVGAPSLKQADPAPIVAQVVPASGEVEHVADEDVVPDQLKGQVWVVQATDAVVVGELGSQARLRLPPDRNVLGVTASVVVSSTIQSDGASAIYFTSRETGEDVFAPASVDLQLFDGKLSGSNVFATGFDARSSGDPGVVAISTVSGSVRFIIDPAPVTEMLGPIGRSILVSPSGATLISSLCNPSACVGGAIIDGLAASVSGELLTDMGPSSLTDEYVLVRGGGHTTVDLALVDIVTGKEQWRAEADRFGFAYVTDSGAVIVNLSESGTARLAIVSLDGSKDMSDPLIGREPTLWPELSSDELAVVGNGGPFPGFVGEDGVVNASFFDLAPLSVSDGDIRISLGTRP